MSTGTVNRMRGTHGDRRLTRRQALLAGTTTVAALALGASERRLGSAATQASASAASAEPEGNAIISRPDLRLPALTVAATTDRLAPGLIMVAPYNAPGLAQRGALIADDTGSPIWEQPLTDLIMANLRVQIYKGTSSLTWWEGDIDLGHGVGSYVVADTSYRPIAHLNAGNGYNGDLHEFLLTDRGTALLTTYAVTHHDLRAVGGPADGTIQDAIFQEIDVASGRVLLEWHSLDHIPVTESYWGVSANWDYVHLNSIAVDHDHNLLVSARNTHTIYKIDRNNGEIIWRLGGKHTNFSIAPDAAFAWQHDARRQPNGTITLFDNGDTRSRGVALNVDERAKRVTLQRSYVRPGNLHSLSQGNVQALSNGNIFVGWGAQPYVSEFSASGEFLFDARIGSGYIAPSGLGYISYRAYRMPWSAIGIGSPAVAVQRGAHHTNVYVSWNGDTRVRHWAALAGSAVEDLAPVGTLPRTSFETNIRLPAAYSRLRLTGIDAAGRALTTTDPIVI